AEARLRSLDRGLARARRAGLLVEALELARDRGRLLAAEGSRDLLPPEVGRCDFLTLAGRTREEDLDPLREEARRLLDESSGMLERLLPASQSEHLDRPNGTQASRARERAGDRERASREPEGGEIRANDRFGIAHDRDHRSGRTSFRG